MTIIALFVLGATVLFGADSWLALAATIGTAVVGFSLQFFGAEKKCCSRIAVSGRD